MILGDQETIADDDAFWARVRAETADLVDCSAALGCNLLIVTNEVGMGLVPPYPAGRLYRDLLGRANQVVASAADSVYLMVAGIPVDVKALGRSVT